MTSSEILNTRPQLRKRSFFIYGTLFLFVAWKLVSSKDCVAKLENLSYLRYLAAVSIPLAVVIRAYRRQSLSVDGCIAAFVIGVIITLVNGIYCVTLLAFFFVSTKATHTQESRKIKMGLRSSPRNGTQVLCNGGLVAVIALLQLKYAQPGEFGVAFRSSTPSRNNMPLIVSLLSLAVLGTVACSTGDTLASELAPLYSRSHPVLLTEPWRKVPIGTNGGITPAGVLLSTAGGLFIGLVFALTSLVFTIPFRTRALASLYSSSASLVYSLLIGAFAGTVGSLIDSFLGSTLQFSGLVKNSNVVVEKPGPAISRISGSCVLDNNFVNLLACLITSVLTVYVSYILFL